MGNAGSDMARVTFQIASGLIVGLLETFMKKPHGTNDTVQAIQENNEHHKRERHRCKAEEEERWREREASARQREQASLDAARQVYEDAIREREEAAISVAKQLEESARQREEAAQLAVKEIEAKATLREEAAFAAAKEREEAALLSIQQIEIAARAREEAALTEAAKAKEDLHKGIRPVVMPTPEQVAAALERMQFHPEKLHFAVCGSSGSGKSTVINAVRGLRCKGEGAARVGVTECTSEIGRHPDPRKELPYSRFVWYDIPGAGTTMVPDWQYFNDQGLFVFDFIIMVYDVRFTKIDVGIIENCLRFSIPIFILRSKADQHIRNMVDVESDCEPGDTEYDQVYQDMAKRYVSATRSDFFKHMEDLAENKDIDTRHQQLIYSLRVYIVSAATLRGLLQTKPSVKKGKVIDEIELVEDMIRAAARRRYSNTPGETTKTFFRKGKEALSAGLSSLKLNTGSEKKKNCDPKPAGVLIVDPKANENEEPTSGDWESIEASPTC